MAGCACEITSYDGQRVRGAESAARVGVRSAGWRQRPSSERAEQAGAATVVAPKRPEQQRPEQKRPEPSAARSHGAIAAPEAHGGAKRCQLPPDLEVRLAIAVPAEGKAAAEVRAPAEANAAAENQVNAKALLEAQVKALLQAGAPAEARTLLLSRGECGAPLTEFYLGVCVSQLEGEAAACEHYEACLRQRPGMHAARNNLIRALLQRRTPAALTRAAEHAELAAKLQPGVAEMHYQLGVVYMQSSKLARAEAAFAAALQIDPAHRGALVNGAHVLGMFPPSDKAACARLLALARLGVTAGVWRHPLQRPPHLVPGLESRPWHEPASFPFTRQLRAQHATIKAEYLAACAAPGATSAVGSRAVHDGSLVASGEWRELPLFGSQRRCVGCAACPATAALVEGSIPAAFDLAMAGGGETLFSVLRPGTHLRPHCGSTNSRLTCHLGVVVPGGARVRVGEEWREWTEGECLVFDDSWEHEVVHEGSSDRVVLLLNFWHPQLAPADRRIEFDNGGYQPI